MSNRSKPYKLTWTLVSSFRSGYSLLNLINKWTFHIQSIYINDRRSFDLLSDGSSAIGELSMNCGGGGGGKYLGSNVPEVGGYVAAVAALFRRKNMQRVMMQATSAISRMPPPTAAPTMPPTGNFFEDPALLWLVEDVGEDVEGIDRVAARETG